MRKLPERGRGSGGAGLLHQHIQGGEIDRGVITAVQCLRCSADTFSSSRLLERWLAPQVGLGLGEEWNTALQYTALNWTCTVLLGNVHVTSIGRGKGRVN